MLKVQIKWQVLEQRGRDTVMSKELPARKFPYTSAMGIPRKVTRRC